MEENANQTILQVKNLSLSYQNVQAVQNLSFTVNTGEIFAILGPNGSGKTSTIECVEGLRKPNQGSIQIFGLDPWTYRQTIYQKLGIQLQETEYPAKIKVAELCRLFASFYEKPADWQLLLSQLNLESKKDRLVRKLSGGEKQRLSILLALMGRPKLLILDELTTGLDPEARQNIWNSLANIRNKGISILMVSHYPQEIEILADRILYMENGQGRFLGTLSSFRDYVRDILPPASWRDDFTLEQLYLMITPKTDGITMEGIL